MWSLVLMIAKKFILTAAVMLSFCVVAPSLALAKQAVKSREGQGVVKIERCRTIRDFGLLAVSVASFGWFTLLALSSIRESRDRKQAMKKLQHSVLLSSSVGADCVDRLFAAAAVAGAGPDAVVTVAADINDSLLPAAEPSADARYCDDCDDIWAVSTPGSAVYPHGDKATSLCSPSLVNADNGVSNAHAGAALVVPTAKYNEGGARIRYNFFS